MTHPHRAVIIALHNLTYSSRVLKQADALAAAGFDVTLVGIVQNASDALEEQQGPVRLVRVRTTTRLHAERAADGVAASAAATPSRPGFFAGVRTFLGRMRDNRLLAEAALAAQPDVVIVSDILTLSAGYRLKRLRGIPLVLDVRDLVLDSGGDLAPSYAWLLGRLERLLVPRADAITTVSPYLGDVLAERFPDAPRAVAIYSGAFESVTRACPPSSPLRLFFQGRIVPNRRLDELIRAMAMMPDVEVTLTIQGFGEDEPRMRALAAEPGLSDRVTFIPPCEARDVVRSASEYDVGVISYRGDTLNLRVSIPIKLLDYIAGGLAVLASDLPGLRSVIEAEACGYLFEQTGPESIAQAIRYLADNPDLVAEMKRNSVRAAPKYLASAQGERFVGVVESVLTASGARGGAA
ncbi:MAG: glycosyltransferase family 4 protein [Actinomycetota bacterium]|nr:glycosyltransferase family 4 protein [Actinomycetota bacterium]MDZ4179381.1 glycosyltransferase family 4 protein [Coriobacteriia bacterium]